MNILFVSAFEPTGKESGANRLRKLSKGLSLNGAKVYWLHSGAAVQGNFYHSVSLNSRGEGKVAKIFAMIREASRWARDHQGVILVSMPPPWLVLVAALLSARWTKRVWLDYRDPLLNQKINPRSLMFRIVVNFLDWFAISFSAGSILAAPRILDYLPAVPRIKECVYAGIDPNEQQVSARAEENTLLYGGTFYAGRSPIKLMEYLKQPSIQKRIPTNFRIKLYAEFNDPADENSLKNLIRDPLLSFVELRSLIPRADFLREVAKARSLLIITHDEGSEYAIPGKIFDYLTLNKPILAISRDRALKDFASEFDLPVTFLNEEIQSEFEQKLIQFLEKSEAVKQVHPDLQIKKQAKKFLDVIE